MDKKKIEKFKEREIEYEHQMKENREKTLKNKEGCKRQRVKVENATAARAKRRTPCFLFFFFSQSPQRHNKTEQNRREQSKNRVFLVPAF